MSDSHDAAWRVLLDTIVDAQQQTLSAITRPFSQGAGQIDTRATLQQLAADYVRDPARWQQMQQSWYQQQLALWTRMIAPEAPHAEPADAPARDRRFRAPEWREPYYDWLSRSYLITSQWLDALAGGVELSSHEKKKVAFLIRQWIDAASPANFGWSNPEAIKLAAETQGASLARGLHPR